MKKILSRFFERKKPEVFPIPEYLPNSAITLEMIPPRGAPWHDIVLFSLSFNNYQKGHEFNRCTELAGSRECTSLTEMRAFLSGEQRRFGNRGGNPDPGSMEFIYDVLDRMREKLAKGEID